MGDNDEKLEPFNWQMLHSPDDPVIGVDEVGRGCLAGPVYAAAVILDPKHDLSEYTDSKILSALRREKLARQILTHHRVGIGFATVEEISEFNILQATFLAMKRALKELAVECGHILVDGHMKIPGLEGFRQTPLVKGDFRATPIAAASIVAKVCRDRVLAELGMKYPQYGFEKHKGYSTPFHQEAIRLYGPCEHHRPTFAGVREYLSDQQLQLIEE